MSGGCLWKFICFFPVIECSCDVDFVCITLSPVIIRLADDVPYLFKKTRGSNHLKTFFTWVIVPLSHSLAQSLLFSYRWWFDLCFVVGGQITSRRDAWRKDVVGINYVSVVFAVANHVTVLPSISKYLIDVLISHGRQLWLKDQSGINIDELFLNDHKITSAHIHLLLHLPSLLCL